MNHLQGSKITVYKMKSKKKFRRTIGFRQKLTQRERDAIKERNDLRQQDLLFQRAAVELNNRLIDSFYGSSRAEIEENWLNYLN